MVHLYVANQGVDTVSVINTVTNMVDATISVGDGPSGVAITPDGAFAYVTNQSSDTISIIDTATNMVDATITMLVGDGPLEIVFTPDGTRAYVTNFFSVDVSVIDTTTMPPTVIATIPIGVPGIFMGLVGAAITVDGTRVYVADETSNTVYVIQTSDNTVIDTIPIAGFGGPTGVAIIPAQIQTESINLSPDTATNDLLINHTVIATIDTNGTPEPDVLVTFEVISGPNAGLLSMPNNGECSPNDCATDSNGQVSWTYSSVIPGTDIIEASFVDMGDQVIESNLVEKIWVSIVILSPDTATNDTGTDHTVTATVEIDGIPEVGGLITFEVISGPNAGEMSDPGNGECTPNDDCTTDGNGQVSWTYRGGRFPGTDTIVVSFFDEEFQVIIESNLVEKIWVMPPHNIPTLSEWGLLAMAGILGLVGFMVIRRRKITA